MHNDYVGKSYATAQLNDNIEINRLDSKWSWCRGRKAQWQHRHPSPPTMAMVRGVIVDNGHIWVFIEDVAKVAKVVN